MDKAKKLFARRKQRVRHGIRTKSRGRIRLSVQRSLNHIYAQVIDDVKGVTLAAASSKDAELKLASGGNVAAAKAVGALVAKRAKAVKVSKVVFDRGGFLFHGRIKALADAAREAGLEF